MASCDVGPLDLSTDNTGDNGAMAFYGTPQFAGVLETRQMKETVEALAKEMSHFSYKDLWTECCRRYKDTLKRLLGYEVYSHMADNPEDIVPMETTTTTATQPESGGDRSCRKRSASSEMGESNGDHDEAVLPLKKRHLRCDYSTDSSLSSPPAEESTTISTSASSRFCFGTDGHNSITMGATNTTCTTTSGPNQDSKHSNPCPQSSQSYSDYQEQSQTSDKDSYSYDGEKEEETACDLSLKRSPQEDRYFNEQYPNVVQTNVIPTLAKYDNSNFEYELPQSERERIGVLSRLLTETKSTEEQPGSEIQQIHPFYTPAQQNHRSIKVSSAYSSSPNYSLSATRVLQNAVSVPQQHSNSNLSNGFSCNNKLPGGFSNNSCSGGTFSCSNNSNINKLSSGFNNNNNNNSSSSKFSCFNTSSHRFSSGSANKQDLYASPYLNTSTDYEQYSGSSRRYKGRHPPPLLALSSAGSETHNRTMAGRIVGNNQSVCFKPNLKSSTVANHQRTESSLRLSRTHLQVQPMKNHSMQGQGQGHSKVNIRDPTSQNNNKSRRKIRENYRDKILKRLLQYEPTTKPGSSSSERTENNSSKTTLNGEENEAKFMSMVSQSYWKSIEKACDKMAQL